jgi:hypothetical protein
MNQHVQQLGLRQIYTNTLGAITKLNALSQETKNPKKYSRANEMLLLKKYGCPVMLNT